MILARVVGAVVATRKHPSHEGRKLLRVQPVDLEGRDEGAELVALDAVDAGVGDRVLVVREGYAAMTAVGRPRSPISTAVVGVVDHAEWTAGD